MGSKDTECLVVGVGSEGGAGSAALLTPDFLTVGSVNVPGFGPENLDFFR